MKEGCGYSGKILRVDLSSRSITQIPTRDYAEQYLGGFGIATRIFWEEVPPEVAAFSPENLLMFMNGPLAGFSGLAGSRWVVCGKSPATVPEHFASSNLGGCWGARLKFAGYDGIVFRGRADKPVYCLIRDASVEIRDASHLWGKGAVTTRTMLKEELGDKTAVVACGPAGETGVAFAIVLADNDASGSCGLGAVMGSKNLKAVAVQGNGKVRAADPERLVTLVKHFHELWQGVQIVRHKGTQLGKQQRDHCSGCLGSACTRACNELEDGSRHKSFCMPPPVFYAFASLYYGDMTRMPNREVPIRATMMLDDYGLDAHGVVNLMALLAIGSQAGMMTEEATGLPLSKLGSLEFIEALLKMISTREGFGDVMAQGIWKTADALGEGVRGLLSHAPVPVGLDGRLAPYCPRSFPAHALLYALEPTLRIQQLHEMALVHFRWLPWADADFVKESYLAGLEKPVISSDTFRRIAGKFWGSELAADFSTPEGKALAARKIQDRSYGKESLILCDELWPVTTVAAGDHIGDPTLESRIVSAVTGREMDEEELYQAGERIFNLRRAITIRERKAGREGDILPELMFSLGLNEGTENPKCLAPGSEGEIISLKGAVVDRGTFEKLKDEYYRLRGWDASTGLQTEIKLQELGLPDVARELAQEGLLAKGDK